MGGTVPLGCRTGEESRNPRPSSLQKSHALLGKQEILRRVGGSPCVPQGCGSSSLAGLSGCLYLKTGKVPSVDPGCAGAGRECALWNVIKSSSCEVDSGYYRPSDLEQGQEGFLEQLGLELGFRITGGV